MWFRAVSPVLAVSTIWGSKQSSQSHQSHHEKMGFHNCSRNVPGTPRWCAVVSCLLVTISTLCGGILDNQGIILTIRILAPLHWFLLNQLLKGDTNKKPFPEPTQKEFLNSKCSKLFRCKKKTLKLRHLAVDCYRYESCEQCTEWSLSSYGLSSLVHFIRVWVNNYESMQFQSLEQFWKIDFSWWFWFLGVDFAIPFCDETLTSGQIARNLLEIGRNHPKSGLSWQKTCFCS